MACPNCGSTNTMLDSSTEKYDYYICTNCGNTYGEKK